MMRSGGTAVPIRGRSPVPIVMPVGTVSGKALVPLVLHEGIG
jgi:hypothetical protein